MSFSKAKLQRFNEIQDCTPSPAKYNIDIKEKIKLGLISKTESKKVDTSSQKSDTGSVQSTPCRFQTPIAPLKRKKVLGISFSRNKAPSAAKLIDEELREKTVECHNKDVYIQDLTEQIEELTAAINNLKAENSRLEDQKIECESKQLQNAKNYKNISDCIKLLGKDLKTIKQQHEDLQSIEFTNILVYVRQFQDLYNETTNKYAVQLEKQAQVFEQKQTEDEKIVNHLKSQYEDQMRKNKEKNEMEFEALKSQHTKALNEMSAQLEDSAAKIRLLEENLNDVTVLTQIQMKDKIEEVELSWKEKLESQEKEAEAILKECQAISEYSIIQCEVEKNQIKKHAEDVENNNKELVKKNQELEEELSNIKCEKHAYELSISTFKDTIEVLKRRLINSDRDVEQLKEELEKCEEKIINYEQKCSDLTTQLEQTQLANDELEMQYESTSTLMQTHIETIHKQLLKKVDAFKQESEEQKVFLKELLDQCHQQQLLVNDAQKVITKSTATIEYLEKGKTELEAELNLYKLETEEMAEIRKKYIEKSGKYDKLAQQFEQILQDLDQSKDKINELEGIIAAYQTEIKVLKEQKQLIECEVQELTQKYTDIVGHQNHNQKIKHLHDLKMKSSELFNKNIDLETTNLKLHKTIEKLMSELDSMKKIKKKGAGSDKENFPSPKSIKVQSPGPLKDKN